MSRTVYYIFHNTLTLDARGTVGDRVNRDLFDLNSICQHFLKKTDIKNIEAKVKDFSIKRHQNDATSVNLIVRNEPYNPVLIYKPQGRSEPELPMLQDDTFVLAIQTKFQKDLYEAHASTILCIDSTHGTNQYRFKLITCIVPDDHGKGMLMCTCPWVDPVYMILLLLLFKNICPHLIPFSA